MNPVDKIRRKFEVLAPVMDERMTPDPIRACAG
jgi:hypothetical protein